MRLLYTNPFVDAQELRNALWEAVRCRQLEVLRSLLEFRVDPDGAPSPEVSRPPASLRHTPWTPLLALAVNGCPERAHIVAELVGCQRHNRSASPQRPQAPSLPHKTAWAEPEASFSTTMPSLQTLQGVNVDEAPFVTAMPMQSQQRDGMTSDLICTTGIEGLANAATPTRRRCLPGSCDVAVQCENKADRLVATILGDSCLLADQDPCFHELSEDALAAMEQKLESTLNALRRHRQTRWEKQLRSVQRRHAEECRGRQSLEDEQACVVCSEAAKAILFMPCRHLCACESCSRKLVECPICRTAIEEQVHCIRP